MEEAVKLIIVTMYIGRKRTREGETKKYKGVVNLLKPVNVRK